jgi:hypothetical protein
MWRKLQLLVVLAAALSVAGCDHAQQADHEQLRADHEQLVQNLGAWSSDVFDWQGRTYQTICELAALADPNGDGDYADIGEATRVYCGPTGGGSPNPPPDWGT